MPVFFYTARDQAGNRTAGRVEAENNSLAAAQLREQGLWITDIRLDRSTAPSPAAARPETGLARRLRSPVSPRDLAIFYRQLHTLLQSGIPFFQSMEMLCQPGQCPNAALRPVVREIANHVLTGGRFSEPMYRYPWLFDRMQIRMVEAGEAGGLLAEIFRRLAEYMEREHQIRSEISRKTLYPKLVLGLLVLVWPINIPLTLAGYLRDLGTLLLYLGFAGGALWFGGRVFFTSRAGRRLYDQVKLAIPVVGPVLRKLATARFARSLAALYGAGVPISAALTMAGEASGHHILEEESARMVPALERGIPLSECLAAPRFFPSMFLGMVATGESTGNLDTMLDKAAHYYEEEGEHAINQMVVTLGVVMLIIAAIIVAIKLISFYTGYLGGIMGGAGGLGGE